MNNDNAVLRLFYTFCAPFTPTTIIHLFILSVFGEKEFNMKKGIRYQAKECKFGEEFFKKNKIS